MVLSANIYVPAHAVAFSMPVLPFHKYIGPGNSLDSGVPVNLADDVAREHDHLYDRAQDQSDIAAADLRAASEFVGTGSVSGAIGAAGLYAKYGIEKAVGPIYGMPRYQNLLGVPPRTLSPPRIHILDNRVIRPGTSRGGKRAGEERQQLQDSKRPTIEEYQAVLDSPIAGDTPGAMEVDEPGPSQVAGDAAGGAAVSRAGSGPGMGAVGAGGAEAASIFTGKGELQGTLQRKTFRTASRWINPTCASMWARLHEGTELWVDQMWKIGSTVHVPWDSIFMYMSKAEYMWLQNCQSVKFHGVRCKVVSLGTRAPYSTARSNIEVANANLQAPLVDYFGINHYFRVKEYLGAFHRSMWGDDIGSGPQAPYSATFANVSAQLEPRIIRNRLYISLDDPMVQASVENTYGTISYPALTDCIVKMINSSNHLGVSFEHEHSFSPPVIYHKSYPTNKVRQITSKLDGIKGIFPVHTYAQGGKNIDIEDTLQDNWHLQSCWPAYDVMSLPGWQTGKETAIPTFAFGLYNIRNFVNDPIADTGTAAPNDIIDMNHDFILEMELDVEFDLFVPFYRFITPGKEQYNPYHKRWHAGKGANEIAWTTYNRFRNIAAPEYATIGESVSRVGKEKRYHKPKTYRDPATAAQVAAPVTTIPATSDLLQAPSAPQPQRSVLTLTPAEMTTLAERQMTYVGE